MKENSSAYTLLVIDFDGTYDNEGWGGNGVEPAVYLIPLDKQIEAENLAREAASMFQEPDEQTPIGDIFEDLMEKNGIKYQYVGSLDITYGERQAEYLPDYIPRVIV